MPTITRLNGSTGAEISSGSSLVTASFTPTGNRLLIVSLSYTGTDCNSVSSTLSITGSWTLLNPAFASNGNSKTAIAYAVTASSPGTGTVTFTMGSTSFTNYVFIDEVSDFNTSAPVTQTQNGSNLTTNGITGTFGSSPASGALLYAFGHFRQDSSGGGLTSFAQTSGWSAHQTIREAFRNKVFASTAAGSNGTGIGWTAGETLDEATFCALEIAAASGGSSNGAARYYYSQL